MPRLLVGNFDFERMLALGADARPPAGLSRILAELSPAWIAVAEDGDVLWCPEPIEPTFFRQVQQHGLPAVRNISRTSDVPPNLQLIPWGWTEEVVRWGWSVGATLGAPPRDVVRTVNSRRFSHQLEQEWTLGLPGAAIAEDLPSLLGVLDCFSATESGWVIKAEFSHASRERFLCCGNHPSDRNLLTRWAQRRFAMGQALFVEPWVERVDEVGVQLSVPREGMPRVEGVTRLLADEAGRYRGSEFTPSLDHDPQWQETVGTALKAARAVQQTGYFGPLGIDAMHYRDAAGHIRLRPLQDVNARWTMGQLSLGLRRLLRPGECGIWWHGRQSPADGDPASQPTSNVREIVTSPPTIGGKPVRMRSIVRIFDPS